MASAATFTVSKTADTGDGVCNSDCSLREAITAANANGAGADTINFNIAGSGVKTITLVSTLPPIQTSLTINGATQTGYFGKPLVEINGGNVPNSNGLEIDSPAPLADISVTIIALAVNRHATGIYSRCFLRCDITLLGNFIGTDATGTASLPNLSQGIEINPTGDIIIGGEGIFEGNVISGNGNVGSGNPNAGIDISPFFSESEFVGEFDVTIKGNKIGTDFDGNTALGNADNGIFISEFNSSGSDVLDLNVTVGGSDALARNIISGNKENGINARVSNLTIAGNHIGTNSAGNVAIPNGVSDSFFTDYGIHISAQNGANYQLGGDAAGEGNVISGNNGYGFYISTGAGGSGTAQLSIQGNRIGTNAAGTSALGNENGGISIDSATNYTINATIGGVTSDTRNIISGNFGDGISVGSGNVSIYGNYIGTDKDGASDLGNSLAGVRVIYNGNVKIGGTVVLNEVSFNAGNLISGNGGNGIDVSTLSNLPVTIRRNRIGTNIGGTSAIPNTENGIRISNNGSIIGSEINSVDGNIISGNGEDGIHLSGNEEFAIAKFTKIYGNRIGTNSIGGDFLPNGQNGIEINDSPNNQIGLAGNGTATNIISGNSERGIFISGTNSTGNKIENNIIGLGVIASDLGNQGSGVEILSGSQNFIGSSSGTGNTIAFNAKGVWVRSGANNEIRRNAIFSNDALGIDLDIAGVTPNDAGDGDGGANRRQNFPVFSRATPNAISGSLNSAPNSNFTIDFYRVDSCDASGSGEGRVFLGSALVLTDIFGDGSFNFPASVVVGQVVTATATVTNIIGADDTSEFSNCIIVTPPPTVSFSAANYAVNEGAASRTITVTRGGATDGIVAVDYAASNGTATAGQDYAATSGTLTFGDGDTIKTFNVSMIEDSIDEADETINLTLSNATGGAALTPNPAAVLTITDNDNAPDVSISDISQNEGNSGTTDFSFQVSLSSESGQNVSVDFATADGTANAPVDFNFVSGTVNFAAGETSKNIVVSVIGDQTAEPGENFFVNLSNAVNTVFSDNQAVGIIINDDVAYQIRGTIRLTDNSPFAGATVNLSGTQTAQTTTDADGRYSFQNLQSNGNFTISPTDGEHTFTPANRQYANLTNDVSEADFTANAANGYEADVAPRPAGTGDGTVSVGDLTQIGRFVVGLDTIPANNANNEFQRADSAPRETLGDGILTVSDYTQVGRYAASLDAVNFAGGPVSPGLFEFDETGKLTAESLNLLEESSGLFQFWKDPARKIATLTTVRVVNVQALPGQQVLISIETDSNGTENGFGFTLDYDAAKLSNPLVQNGVAAPNATLLSNTLQNGKIGVILAMPFGTTVSAGTKQILTIRFDVAAKVPAGNTALTFADLPVFREVADTNSVKLRSKFQDGAIKIFGANAEQVSISGKVLSNRRQGVSGAIVSLIYPDGISRTTMTNPFGNYRFEEIPVGETYTLSVRHKRFQFDPSLHILFVSEDLDEINFTVLPER